MDDSFEIQELIRALPPHEGDPTIIVRITSSGLRTVTVRGDDGQPPMVFGVRPGSSPPALHVLHPESDEELPGAWLLGDPRALARRLGTKKRLEINLLAYRPHARAVARVDGAERPLYIKLLTKRAYRRAEEALELLEQPGEPLRLALPVCCLRKERVLVAEEARGRSLHARLRSGESPDPGILEQALQRFRDSKAPLDLPLRSIEDERRSAVKMLERGARVMPGLEDLIRRVSELPLPSSEEASLVHTDLHDKQIFLAKGQVELIDLEGIARGDPRLDWINLLEHLRLRCLQWPEQGAVKALAGRLRASLAGDAGDRYLAAQAGLVRARLAGVYALRPRWTALARVLARDALRELGPG
ncbi:MAG: hypothetical protein ACE5F1_08265 [Planctomycetota bacterium]